MASTAARGGEGGAEFARHCHHIIPQADASTSICPSIRWRATSSSRFCPSSPPQQAGQGFGQFSQTTSGTRFHVFGLSSKRPRLKAG